MKTLLILTIGLTVSLAAHASRSESGAGNKFYLAEDGKQISALQADVDTTNNKKTFQCQPVEKVCNEKTGKCAIKTVK